MDKRKYHQDLLKEYTMTQNNDTKEMEWYVNLVLNDLLIQRREKELRKKIDHALDIRDKEAFMSLTKELINLIGH